MSETNNPQDAKLGEIKEDVANGYWDDVSDNIGWLIAEVERLRDIRDQVACNYWNKVEENKRLREALEKIADPRKRDHKEPDNYTTIACLMHIANEALEYKDE